MPTIIAQLLMVLRMKLLLLPMDPNYRPHHCPGPPGFNQNQNVQNRGQNQNRGNQGFQNQGNFNQGHGFQNQNQGFQNQGSNIKIKETLTGTKVRVISIPGIFMETTTRIKGISNIKIKEISIKVPTKTIALKISIIHLKLLFLLGLHLTSR
jgi:hypothetical protein